jgi:hypothetical protein
MPRRNLLVTLFRVIGAEPLGYFFAQRMDWRLRDRRISRRGLPGTLILCRCRPNQVSSDTENRLISVTAKVQSAEETLRPIGESLARNGQTFNADILNRLSLMRATLDKANRDLQAGDTAAATESLSKAEALADKLLHSVGR